MRARQQTPRRVTRRLQGRRADLVTASTTRMKLEACVSCAQHQATLFLARPRKRTRAVPGAVALLATVAKVLRGLLGQAGRHRHCHDRRLRREDQVQEVLYLNGVLNAKGGASGDRRQGLRRRESVQERLGLYYEVTTAFIILTEVELRAALDRNRDLPKYLTRSIPTLEVPLATDPAQRETVFFFRHPDRPLRDLTIRTCHGADRQRCVLDPRDQVYSGQGDVVLNTLRGSTLQGADVSTALDKNSCGTRGLSVRCSSTGPWLRPVGSKKATRGSELGQDVDSDDMDEAAPIISGPAAMLFEGHSEKAPPSGGRQYQGGAARRRR